MLNVFYTILGWIALGFLGTFIVMLAVPGHISERFKMSAILSIGGIFSVFLAFIFTCHFSYIKFKKR